MARVIRPIASAVDVARRLVLESRGADPFVHLDPFLLETVDLVTPFLVGVHGTVLEHANAYLRKRRAGELTHFSLCRLRRNSIYAYAEDLAYFLNIYGEPSLALLRRRAKGGKLLAHYVEHLEAAETKLSASTITRRLFIAREFLAYVMDLPEDAANRLDQLDTGLRRHLVSQSNQRISYFSSPQRDGGRRRHPTKLALLPPMELRRFFESFLDPMLAAAAKLIFATGLRREEATQIRAGDIAKLSAPYKGGVAILKVVGKGNKERSIDIEPALLHGLKALLVSKSRMERTVLYGKKHSGDPYSDAAPLFVDRYGDPLSKKAVTEGFARASVRCGIKRTPHELRHEFAANYLLNAYRALAKKLDRNGLDTWLVRLMVDKNDLVLIRLSHLLGHASPDTTKKIYLVALVQAEPSIRDSWCRHLDDLDVHSLAVSA